MDAPDPLGSYGLCAMELAHKPVFDLLFSTTRPQLSDYTFANTFIWRDCIHIRWRVLHDCLCVFANGEEGLSLLFPPIGRGDFPAALAEAMDICRAFSTDIGIDRRPRVEYVSESLLPRLPSDSVVQPMSGDYVYATQRLIDLSGSDLRSKRGGRNAFARHYDVRTETFAPRHVPLCLALLELWRAQVEGLPASATTSVRVKREKEMVATISALQNAEALGLTGMVLYADDRMVGFTLGELLHNRQTCSILIEKTDRNFCGSASYIFWEFCRAHWADTRWCNTGDDWEVPSLAWTKQSYRPAFRLGKWVVWPSEPARLVLAVAPADGRARAAAPSPPPSGNSEQAAPPAQADHAFERAGPADLKQLLLLETRCFDAETAFSRRRLRYLLRCPRATTYALRQDGQIIGAATVLRRRFPGAVSARLYNMAVEPSQRRRGLGRALLRQCLDTLRAEGVCSVHLEVAETNVPAIGLYESMGFTEVRHLGDYYGRGGHAWRMRAALTADGHPGDGRRRCPAHSVPRTQVTGTASV